MKGNEQGYMKLYQCRGNATENKNSFINFRKSIEPSTVGNRKNDSTTGE